MHRSSTKEKIIPLFLIVAIFYTVASAEANELRNAIENGKFSGDVRNIISIASTPEDAIPEAGIDSSTKSAGSSLSLFYQTGEYRGFSIGGRAQLGVDWNIHDDESGLTIFGGEEDIRITAEGGRLQNLFVDYSFEQWGSNSKIRIGRQDIVSPLIMRSGLFPMWDAFEGIVFTNQDIDKTRVQLMAFDKWFKRYGVESSNRNIVERNVKFDDPVLSVYITSNKFDNLKIDAQYLLNRNDIPLGDAPTLVGPAGEYEVFFLESNYSIPNTIFSVGAEVMHTRYKENSDPYFIGLRLKYSPARYSFELAYTHNDSDATSPGTLGLPPWFKTYARTYTAAEIFAGVSTYTAILNYNFGYQYLNSSLNLSLIRQTDKGKLISNLDLDDAYQISADIRYKVQKFNGLTTRLQLGYGAFNDEFNDNDFVFSRVFVNYTF